MNDYLTNLAARALAPVPTIVPRQGSLFEPVAARNGAAALRLPADDWESGRDESIEIEPQPATTRPRLVPARPRPAESPAEPAAQLAAPDPPSTSASQPREAQPVVAAAARLAKTEPLSPAPIMEPPPVAAPAPPPRLRSMVADRPRPPQDLDESSREEPAPKESRRIRQRKVDASDAGEVRDDTERRSQRSATPIREPFAPTVVIAPPTRHEPATAAPSHQPAAPPTIRITIGRVEVRAVAALAAAAAVPRAAGRPRLSLEDYLNERSGGRR